jgi:hypothetical protein
MTGKYKSKSLATRLKKVEYKLKNNTAEVKAYQDSAPVGTVGPLGFIIVPLLNFGQGTGDSQRIGNEIKLTGFRLHNSSSNNIVSSMLVLSKDGTVPNATDFLAVPHTQIIVGQRHILRVVKYLYNFGGQNHQVTHFEKRYKSPLRVGYNNLGQVNKNALYLVAYNAGTVNHTHNFSWTCYYRDA